MHYYKNLNVMSILVFGETATRIFEKGYVLAFFSKTNTLYVGLVISN